MESKLTNSKCKRLHYIIHDFNEFVADCIKRKLQVSRKYIKIKIKTDVSNDFYTEGSAVSFCVHT